MASRVSQYVNFTESSPRGNENSGSADWMVKGVVESCLSKTSFHVSCRKRGWLSSKDHMMSFIDCSHLVLGCHDLGALSGAENYSVSIVSCIVRYW